MVLRTPQPVSARGAKGLIGDFSFEADTASGW